MRDDARTRSITLDILRKIQEGIGDLRRGFGDVRHGLDEVRGRLDRVEGEVGGLREEVRGNSLRLDAVEGQLRSHGKRIGGVETRMHELVQVTTLSISRQLDLGHRVDAIEERVTALESR